MSDMELEDGEEVDVADAVNGAEGEGQGQVSTAPPMYLRPSFYHQTRRKGKIMKIVSERYLRDDLGFGCYFVDESSSNKRSKDAVDGKPHVIGDVEHLLSLLRPCQPNALVICDTNVLLHNLDVIEQSRSVMSNLVFPQTALLECRSNKMVAYDRAVEILREVTDKNNSTNSNRNSNANSNSRCCIFFPDQNHSETAHVQQHQKQRNTSINDENDARIRNVAALFGEALQGSDYRVILLTDDQDCRKRATEEQNQHGGQPLYEAKSVRGWVKELEAANPNIMLSDLIAQHGKSTTASTSITASAADGGEEQEEYFPSHLGQAELSIGVKTEKFYRGVLRCQDNVSAWVTVRQGDERVAVSIEGPMDRNRAVDGDVVAIALHPLEKWHSTTSRSKNKQQQEQPQEKNDHETGIARDTADPTQNEMANVQETLTVDADGAGNNESSVEDLRPTAKVVGILRRNFTSYSGSIFEKPKDTVPSSKYSEREKIASQYEREHWDGTTTCVFFPVDKRISPILIRTTQRDRFLGQRIIVCMDSWPSTSPYPLGHYVKLLGPAGSKDVETQVLLQEHKIAHEPFSAAVLACLPPNDYKIEMTSDRLDLRHLPVLSIDPPGCKDIDDALHCLRLPNGNYQVGVHIADVTHYVKAGSAMDLEAANRSTSTYLVNKRLDMLPALLTTDLCSLKGNVDRYAFSVLWEVTPDAQIINVDFKKSIIHSIAALTYQEAQSFIDQPDDTSNDGKNNSNNDPRVSAVKGLASLARKFRQRRIDGGALTLASPEVKFVLDSESLNPTDVQAYALLEANALVEEFMLLANVTVGKKILRHYPTLSVLRRHPAPNRSMFQGLIGKAKSRGVDINIEDSKRLADSLDAAVIDGQPYFNKLLRILSTRCMSPAQYFCSGEFRPTEWHHYGLAAPVYTHFTSPIRRYADVCVHRLLAAAINVAPLPVHLSSKSHLHDLCANMNRRHRSAQLAGRASVQLHTLIFFADDDDNDDDDRNNNGHDADKADATSSSSTKKRRKKKKKKEEDAYVLDVDTTEKVSPSLTVIIPRYGIEGRIRLPIEPDDPNLMRLPEQHKMTYATTGAATTTAAISIQVFDKVRVQLWVQKEEDHKRELIIDLVSPQFQKGKEEEEEENEEDKGIGEDAVDTASKRKLTKETTTITSTLKNKRRRKT